MNRISKYFSSDGGELFMYEQGGVFHSTGQSLSTAVWTDEETNKLCMYVTQNGKHNWEGAVEQLPNKTSFDCFIHYTNKADPELNWNEWTAEEEARLSELSNTHDDHNWCEIAEELGTGRTPFECLKHFQRNLNQRLVNNSDWTQDEDELLKLAVEEHGKNWQLVATLVPNRSATQCLNRWGKSTVCQEEMVAGKWSDEEERLLFLAALAYAAPRHSDGKKSEQELQNLLATGSPGLAHNGGSSKRAYSKWKEIAALVPGKSEIQCREKWTSSLDPSINTDPYSEEEDNRLRQVVSVLQQQSAAPTGKPQPMKWALVAQFMPGRTDASVRSRFLLLEKWRKGAEETAATAAAVASGRADIGGDEKGKGRRRGTAAAAVAASGGKRKR